MSKATKSAPRKTGKTAAAALPLKSILPKDMDAKIARRKLRAAGLSFHSKKERWVFTPAQAKQAREALGA